MTTLAKIKFAWLTGAPPQEAYIVQDSQVDLKEQRITIPASKSKGKMRAKVIYLPPAAYLAQLYLAR